MRKFSRFKYLGVIICMMTCLALLACSPGQPKEPVGRKAEVAEPERAIEQPLKAGRITEEEYAQATKEKGNIGLVDNPKLNFDLDTPCAYEYDSSGAPAGMARFVFVGNGDGFSVEGSIDLFAGQDEEKGFTVKFSCGFDSKLKPKICNLEMPDIFTGTTVKKRVDFTAGKFGVEYFNSPNTKSTAFRQIEHPAGDVWPFIPHANLDVAIIGACTGPPANDAEIWVLNLVQDDIERFSLRYVGEKDIKLENEDKTVKAREYEGFFNENLYGEYYFDADGRLVMVDEAGGMRSELVVVPNTEKTN